MVKYLFELKALRGAVALCHEITRGAVTTLPILQNVLMEEGPGDTVVLTANNLEAGVRVVVEATCEGRPKKTPTKKGSLALPVEEPKAFRVTVPAGVLADILAEVPEGAEVRVWEGARHHIHLACAEGEWTVLSLPADDFPVLAPVNVVARMGLDTQALLTLLKNTLFACPEKNPRRALTGVLFEFDNEQAQVRVTACSGPALVREVLPFERLVWPEGPEGILEVVALVPGTTLKALQRGLVGDGAVIVGVGATAVSFACGVATYYCQQVEGKYPDLGPVIPTTFKSTVHVDRVGLLALLKRVKALAEDKRGVRLVARKGLLEASTEGGFEGEARGSVTCSLEGSAVDATYNPRLFAAVLGSLGGEGVTLKYPGPKQPLLVVSTGGGVGFRALMSIQPTVAKGVE